MMTFPEAFVEFEEVATLQRKGNRTIKAVAITTNAGYKLLDVRLWHGDVPTTCGLFFSTHGVAKLGNAITQFQQMAATDDNQINSLDSLVRTLGYNPFADN